jgi:hypothetical protein
MRLLFVLRFFADDIFCVSTIISNPSSTNPVEQHEEPRARRVWAHELQILEKRELPNRDRS